ncbi:zinc-binding alcohol dehydrogenase family protein [Streptomyces sp. I05A-00742]|uniref:quinone oxidoreductase family protein n=1 Tax=Streptomyces sp. I05A-00742 TaxID=2732853 RepID=UPI00289F2F67|nr:zinc-binding alcohol dehydrogenase family protein [Streptomyces sp. I05A-00742]
MTTTPGTMSAAVLHALGRTPRCERFPEPVAGEGETLVHVTAAALKPVDRWMADGSHYAHHREFPTVVGTDGVGRLDDGRRVVFLGTRRPHGGMARRTVAPDGTWFPLPDDIAVDDVTVAAVTNPGLAAWKAIIWRGRLRPGQTVLVLGATGTSGRIAVQLAKRYGAARVVAAGRDQRVLDELRTLGADATLRLDRPADELVDAFAEEAARTPFDLVVDYVWGSPAQALFTALTRPGLTPLQETSRVLHVQVGQTAGEHVSLSGNALRSTALEIVGSGSGASPSPAQALTAYDELLRGCADGGIRLAIEQLPLSEVEHAWKTAGSARRTVLVP